MPSAAESSSWGIALGGGADGCEVLLKVAKPCAEPLELDIHVSEASRERLEFVRLHRAVDAPGELADSPLDPQSLRLEL